MSLDEIADTIIKRHLKAPRSPDPESLVSEVLAAIRPADREEALQRALEYYVKYRYSLHRLAANNRSAESFADELAELPRSGRGTRSVYVEAVQTYGLEWLNQSYLINGEQKLLAECNREDLLWLSDDLVRQAQNMRNKAQYFRELAAAVGSGKVSDLGRRRLARFAPGASEAA